MQSYKSSEEIEQISLFRWAELAENKYPELKLMYHVPNEGKRSAVTGHRLKQAGLKSGVPDIVLPVARGGYIGLYIELKYGKNKLTKNQEIWLDQLHEQKHLTAVCYGWEEAKDLIDMYMNLEHTTIARCNNMTWIDDATDIVCPHCGQNYDFDIMNMAHGDRIMQFCPKCGNKVDVDSYFNDTIKE